VLGARSRGCLLITAGQCALGGWFSYNNYRRLLTSVPGPHHFSGLFLIVESDRGVWVVFHRYRTLVIGLPYGAELGPFLCGVPMERSNRETEGAPLHLFWTRLKQSSGNVVS